MLSAFKGMDVITFAVEIEKNGEKFYETMANITEDPEISKIFHHLKEQEAQHIIDFQQLLDKAGGYQPQETYTGEYLEYVKALVDNHVFNAQADIDALAKGVKDTIGALDLALRFEKDSIIFFAELKNAVSPQDQETIEELINQEREHIRVLSNLKNQLSA